MYIYIEYLAARAEGLGRARGALLGARPLHWILGPYSRPMYRVLWSSNEVGVFL